MSKYYYLNGKIIEDAQALISVRDVAVLRGFGIFDFFRTANGRPFLIDDYLRRFENSARLIGLPLEVATADIKRIVLELLEKNQLPEAGVRMVLTGGESENAFLPGKPNFAIIIEDLRWPVRAHFGHGIRLASHEYQREFSQIKSINYLMALMLQDKIRRAEADDALYFSGNEIREATRSNFFMVKNKTVITPHEQILPGITRKKALELSRMHYKVEERTVLWNEIQEADECFLTGTTKKITPVVRIDDRIIADGKPGPVTRDLMKLFDEFEARN